LKILVAIGNKSVPLALYNIGKFIFGMVMPMEFERGGKHLVT
jgi:uncharacterized membrane protein